MERQRVGEIVEGAERALAEFCRQQGLAVSYKGGSIGQGNCTLRFEFSELDASGKAQTEDAENFRLFAPRFGLKPEDLGRKFAFRGQQYEVIGLRPSAEKYPVLAKRLTDGKVFKFPATQIGGRNPYSFSADARAEMRAEALGS